MGGLSGLGLLGIAVAFGLSVVVFAYAIGGITGCHINPAVTVGVLLAGRMSAKDAVVYIVAQFIGALLGAFVLQQLLNGQLAGFTAGEWAYDPMAGEQATRMNMELPLLFLSKLF